MPGKLTLLEALKLDTDAQHELGFINEDALNLAATYVDNLNLILQDARPENWSTPEIQSAPTLQERVDTAQVPSDLLQLYIEKSTNAVAATTQLQTRNDTISEMRKNLAQFKQATQEHQQVKAKLEHYLTKASSVGQMFFGIDDPDTVDFMDIKDEDLKRLVVSTDQQMVDGGYIAQCLAYYYFLGKQLNVQENTASAESLRSHIEHQIALLTKYQHIFCGILMQRSFITQNKGRSCYLLDKANIASKFIGKEIKHQCYDLNEAHVMQAMNIHVYASYIPKENTPALKNTFAVFSSEMQLVKARSSLLMRIKEFFTRILNFFFKENLFSKIRNIEEYKNESERLLVKAKTDLHNKNISELIHLFLYAFGLQNTLQKTEPKFNHAYAPNLTQKALRECKEAKTLICERINEICLDEDNQTPLQALTPDEYDILCKIQVVHTLKELKNEEKHREFMRKTGIAYQIINQGLFTQAPGIVDAAQQQTLNFLQKISTGDATVLNTLQDTNTLELYILQLAHLFPDYKSVSDDINKNRGAALLEVVLCKFVMPRIYSLQVDPKNYIPLLNYIKNRTRYGKLPGNESYERTKKDIYPTGVTYSIKSLTPAIEFYQQNKENYEAVVGTYNGNYQQLTESLRQLEKIREQLLHRTNLSKDVKLLIQDFLNNEIESLKNMCIDLEDDLQKKITNFSLITLFINHDPDIFTNHLKEDFTKTRDQLLSSARCELNEVKDTTHLNPLQQSASQLVHEYETVGLSHLMIHEDYWGHHSELVLTQNESQDKVYAKHT